MIDWQPIRKLNALSEDKSQALWDVCTAVIVGEGVGPFTAIGKATWNVTDKVWDFSASGVDNPTHFTVLMPIPDV